MDKVADINKLITRDFNFKSFTISGVKCGDNLSGFNLDNIDDIHLLTGESKLTLNEKLNRLKVSSGWIHDNSGLSFEISDGTVNSIVLKKKYIDSLKEKTRFEIENILGRPDKELTDGTTWVTDYVLDAKVLVYNKLKLFIHIDPETERLREIRFGDVNEKMYD